MVPSPPSEITTSRPSASNVDGWGRHPIGSGRDAPRCRARPAASARAPARPGHGSPAGVRDEADRAQRVTRGPATTRASSAGVVEAPGRAASARTRNSTLPSAPRNGDAIDVDHDRADVAAGRRAPRASTARCDRRVAHDPALADPARPASNCGFTSSTRSPSGRVQRAERGRATVTQRDEGQVGDGEVDRAAEVAGLEVARTLVRSRTVDPRVVAQRPRELAAADVDRVHVRGAAPAGGSR